MHCQRWHIGAFWIMWLQLCEAGGMLLQGCNCWLHIYHWNTSWLLCYHFHRLRECLNNGPYVSMYIATPYYLESVQPGCHITVGTYMNKADSSLQTFTQYVDNTMIWTVPLFPHFIWRWSCDLEHPNKISRTIRLEAPNASSIHLFVVFSTNPTCCLATLNPVTWQMLWVLLSPAPHHCLPLVELRKSVMWWHDLMEVLFRVLALGWELDNGVCHFQQNPNPNNVCFHA